MATLTGASTAASQAVMKATGSPHDSRVARSSLWTTSGPPVTLPLIQRALTRSCARLA
jgi:hypothetical protein